MTQFSNTKCVVKLCRMSVSSTVSSRVSSKCVKTSTKINKLDKCRINNTKLLNWVVELCHESNVGLCHQFIKLCHLSVSSKCVVCHDTASKRGYMRGQKPANHRGKVFPNLKKVHIWTFFHFSPGLVKIGSHFRLVAISDW